MATASDPSVTLQQLQLSELDIANRINLNEVFGLVTIRGGVSSEGQGRPAKIRVELDDQIVELAGSDCFIRTGWSGEWRMMVNIFTHLLKNGDYNLRITVVLQDGYEQSFPDFPMRVLNESELSASVAADLVRHGTPCITGRVIDSEFFPYAEGNASAWFDRIEPTDVPLSFDQAEDLEGAHRHLERWGFCILPERLSPELMQEFKTQLFDAIDDGLLPWTKGSSDRIHNAHILPAGRDIWLYPPVMRFLSAHFKDSPCACQTLTYVNGSEQNAHQDTIHLTPYPAGFMCGVWVALEDVQPNSGELFVYPGSHKTKRLRAGELGLEKVDNDYSSYTVFDSAVMELMDQGGFKRMEYRPKAGQILVWHENLVHGGSPRRNRDQTRISIVSHYFAKGAVAYYDSRGEAAALEPLPGV